MEPEDLPYFHPSLASGDEAKKFLMGHLKPGNFILRQSSSSTPNVVKYSLSVVYSDKMIHHVPIEKKGSAFCLVSNQLFEYIPDLVSFYRHADIPNTKYQSLRLLHGVWAQTDDQSHPVNNYQRSSHGVRHQADVPPPRPPKREMKEREMKELPPEPTPERREIQDISNHNFQEGVGNRPPARPRKPDIEKAANNFKLIVLDQPLPLPKNESYKHTNQADIEIIYDRTYSSVGPSRDRTQELIQMLILQEREQSERVKCECGIYLKDSLLPDGWTVHRSSDPATEGQLFFTSHDGITTSWTLPNDVWCKLKEEHIQTLNNLAKANGVSVPAPVEYLMRHMER